MKNDAQNGGEPSDGVPTPQRAETDDASRAKARKWFSHAKTVSETKNYDYAVELYVNGLALWPDAVEEGLKLLRVCAMARKLNGGKPAGFLDAKKHPPSGKDPLKALSNSLYLFCRAPTQLANMEHILLAASRSKHDRTVAWIAPVLVEAMTNEKKLPEKRYAENCTAIEAAADLSTAIKDYELAGDILQAGLRVAQIWSGHYSNSTNAQRAYSSASSKQTIVKGRFGTGDDFRESLKDADEQRDARDKDKFVRSADRNKELVEKARKQWADNPDTPAKLVALAEALTRTEDDDSENEAISLLKKEAASTGEYNLQVKADDIGMRQAKRHGRKILARVKADPKNKDLRKVAATHIARQNKKEIEIFRDRGRHYPTDLKVRFNLATRLFQAKQFDEAIPLFQQTQADGRHKAESQAHLGRCFLEKGFHTQAVDTLRAALEAVESATSEAAKELSYWLARALEADNRVDDAREAYGHLIQTDYNYRDARKRLEALKDTGQD